MARAVAYLVATDETEMVDTMKFAVTKITAEILQDVRVMETHRGSRHVPMKQEFEAHITIRGMVNDEIKEFLQAAIEAAGAPTYVELTEEPPE